MRDIVTSYLPHWTDTRAWIIARPLSGFAETFSQYIMEVFPGGGSTQPEPDAGAEGVLFVVAGQASLTVEGKGHNVCDRRIRLPAARLQVEAAQQVQGACPLPLGPQGLRGGRRHRLSQEPSSPTSRTNRSSGCPKPTAAGALRASSIPPMSRTTCTSTSLP